MVLYNLYIFNRDGLLLYYREWLCRKRSSATMSVEEEARLLYGMLFSLKSFANRISPVDARNGPVCYKTNKYKMSFYETPSGLKFVCNSEVSAPDVRETLQRIYTQVYVDCVVRNPACNMGEPITCDIFQTRLDELVGKVYPSTIIKP